jgi:thiamine pyrophosphate-dependent acetolactate synthase large subunit-like protein
VSVSQGRLAADAHLRADARLGVEALVDALRPRTHHWRTKVLAERIATTPADSTVFDIEPGAIGNGISFAMGVAAACPDETVVLFDGDGSLLMHIQELETIWRHGLNILIIVLNDGAYGSEIHELRAEGLSDVSAIFGRTNFAAIARGFGIGGTTISGLSRLTDAITTFKGTRGAAVWDVPISDRVISPVIHRAHPAGL